jgi:uncharacterized membrane protein YeaQ/YmgE (transglycosylase-associated protein family)
MLWDLSRSELIQSFSFACALSFICGYIADRIMGYTGFGVIGNWLLLLTGVYVGLFTYNQLGYNLDWFPVMTIVIAFSSATMMLMAVAGFKTATNT